MVHIVFDKPSMSVDEYYDKVPGQHIIMAFGDYVEKVKTVCNLLENEVAE